MKNQGKKDRIQHHNGELELTVTVFTFYDQESEQHIAYVPSLEISTYATRQEELEECIEDAIRTTVQYWLDNNTLDQNLEECGWVRTANEVAVPQRAEKASVFQTPGCSIQNISTFQENLNFAIC